MKRRYPDNHTLSRAHFLRSGAAVLLAAALLAGASVTDIAAALQFGPPREAGVTDKRSVRFGSNGELYANGGCNRFRGQYEWEGSDIAMTLSATTSETCAEEIMAREVSFISILTTARSVQVVNYRLVLFDEDGVQLARLDWHDWD